MSRVLISSSTCKSLSGPPVPRRYLNRKCRYLASPFQQPVGRLSQLHNKRRPKEINAAEPQVRSNGTTDECNGDPPSGVGVGAAGERAAVARPVARVTDIARSVRTWTRRVRGVLTSAESVGPDADRPVVRSPLITRLRHPADFPRRNCQFVCSSSLSLSRPMKTSAGGRRARAPFLPWKLAKRSRLTLNRSPIKTR